MEGGASINPLSTLEARQHLVQRASENYALMGPLLVATPSLVTHVDLEGNTILHDLALRGATKAVKVLLTGPQPDDFPTDKPTKTLRLDTETKVTAVVQQTEELPPLRIAYDVRNNIGDTPLHCAAKGGHESTMAELLRAADELCAEDEPNETRHARVRAYVNAMNTRRCTPLHFAAELDRILPMIVLLYVGAEPCPKKGVDTPLHFAASGGYVNTMKVLIKHHAPLEAKNHVGYTPLHEAARCGRPEAIKVLRKAHASLDTVGADLCTPLHVAVRNRCDETVKVLLTACAEQGDQAFLDGTLLHFAAQRGHVEAIQILLKNHALLETTNFRGCTPLHEAARCNSAGAIGVLTDAGANLEAVSLDGRRHTPLQLAVTNGCNEAVKALLVAGAILQVQTTYKHTPLHVATYEGHANVVDTLLCAGLPLHSDGTTGPAAKTTAGTAAKDICGETALHRAMSHKNNQPSQVIVTSLLKAGSAPDAENIRGYTPLNFAAFTAREDLATILFSWGATRYHTELLSKKGRERAAWLKDLGAKTTVLPEAKRAGICAEWRAAARCRGGGALAQAQRHAGRVGGTGGQRERGA